LLTLSIGFLNIVNCFYITIESKDASIFNELFIFLLFSIIINFSNGNSFYKLRIFASLGKNLVRIGYKFKYFCECRTDNWMVTGNHSQIKHFVVDFDVFGSRTADLHINFCMLSVNFFKWLKFKARQI
jgi:hypothetical protein